MAAVVPPAFFSYSRADGEFALRLAQDLKSAGANVWMDQLDIEPGTPWDRAIEEALTTSTRMLVILSPDSANSDNVSDEVSFALSKEKRIIPVLYRECEVPFRLARLQHIDFRTDYGRGLKALIKALGAENQASMNVGAAPALPATGPSTLSGVENRAPVLAQQEREREAIEEKSRLDDVPPLAADEIRLRALIKQAERGSANAMEELAYAYDTGKGVPKDRGKTFHWHLRAAEAGNVTAMFNIANIYSIEEPYKDEQKAFSWFRKAAEAGDRYEMMRLAHAYEHGLGIKRDYGQAVVWYRKACEREVPGAEDDLSRAMLLEEESKRAGGQP